MKLNFRDNILNLLLAIFTVLQVLSNVNILNSENGQSNVIIILSLITIGILMLSTLNIFLKNTKLLLLLLLTIVITLLIYNTNYSNMIFVFWMPYFAAGIGTFKVIKVDFITRSITVLVVIICALLGMIPNIVLQSSTGQFRQSLGFINPNGASEMILIIAMEALILRKNRIRLVDYIQTIFFGIIMFLFTKSRTTAILFVLLLCLTAVFTNKHVKNSRIIKYILILMPTILLMLSFIGTYLYGHAFNETWQKLDQLLSGRLYYANYYLAHYGVSAWGSKLVTQYQIGTDIVNLGSLDNGYLSLLVKFGYVVTITFIVWYSVAIIKLLEHKYYFVMPTIIIFLIMGLSETTFYYSSYNFSFYFLGLFFLKKELTKNESVG